MDLADLFGSPDVTPEELQQLSASGGLDPRQAALEKQMAQAHALRMQRTAGQYSTPVAAALGGITDIINGVKGGQQEAQAQQGMQGLRGDQSQAQLLMADILKRRASRRQALQDDSMASAWANPFPDAASLPDLGGGTGIIPLGDK